MHTASPPNPVDRPHLADAFRDWAFRNIVTLAGWFVLVALGLAALSMLWGGREAFMEFGPGFLTSTAWNPVTEEYGALVAIYGTVVSTMIAMIIAVPVSFGIALFLTEVAPAWIRQPLGTAIELLAGIPSIIYGMWGLFVLAPFLADNVYPWVDENMGQLPLVGMLFFEVVWDIVLPYTRSAVIGGIFLGMGRALGETMAVTFVLGNSHNIHASLLMPGNSIAASIANEFAEATTPMYQSALLALGFVLFIVTFVVLAIAKLMLMRLHKREGN